MNAAVNPRANEKKLQAGYDVKNEEKFFDKSRAPVDSQFKWSRGGFFFFDRKRKFKIAPNKRWRGVAGPGWNLGRAINYQRQYLV